MGATSTTCPTAMLARRAKKNRAGEVEEHGGEGHGWKVEERGAWGLKGTPRNPATRTPRAARKYQCAWRCEGACGLRTGGGNRYARRGERSRNPWGRSWMEASHGATWS